MPPFVTIAPTYRCQCWCVHCGVSAPDRDHGSELETEQVKAVIDQAKRLGVLQITFTGGDPLLRDDIVELVRYAHDAGLLTRINTCGALLSPERVGGLKAAGLSQCAVSIDDVDPATHDELRGVAGAHERAVAGIKNLVKHNILCQINTYASRRIGPAGLKKIVALGRDLGVLAVYIILPTAIGRWDRDFGQVLTEGEKAEVRALQETTFVHLELATPQTLCGVCQKAVLFVSPAGNVTPCPFVPYAFGNVREYDLAEIWRLHCDGWQCEVKGDCIMNDLQARAAIEEHVASVARSLG